MTAEICMFNKFGFCKKGDSCRKIHLVEICLKDGCDARKCDKRHPRPCRFFNQKGFCRFEINCKFSHKPNKTIQEQNLKIEALVEKTEMLLRMIEEQKSTIECLKAKVEERQDKEVDNVKEKENTVKSIQVDNENSEIVFEPLISSKKKKWALKDKEFCERIGERYDIVNNTLDWFDKEENPLECMRQQFIDAAEDLEVAAKQEKITSKDVKSAIRFFREITERSDFTKDNFKNVVTKGWWFIWKELQIIIDAE